VIAFDSDSIMVAMAIPQSSFAYLITCPQQRQYAGAGATCAACDPDPPQEGQTAQVQRPPATCP
jgi:hypothetical protein